MLPMPQAPFSELPGSCALRGLDGTVAISTPGVSRLPRHVVTVEVGSDTSSGLEGCAAILALDVLDEVREFAAIFRRQLSVVDLPRDLTEELVVDSP